MQKPMRASSAKRMFIGDVESSLHLSHSSVFQLFLVLQLCNLITHNMSYSAIKIEIVTVVAEDLLFLLWIVILASNFWM